MDALQEWGGHGYVLIRYSYLYILLDSKLEKSLIKKIVGNMM